MDQPETSFDANVLLIECSIIDINELVYDATLWGIVGKGAIVTTEEESGNPQQVG